MNSRNNPALLEFVSQPAVGKYHYVVHCFADTWWAEDRVTGKRTAVFQYPEGVDKDMISDWFNRWLDLYFIPTDSIETEARQNFTEPAIAQ